MPGTPLTPGTSVAHASNIGICPPSWSCADIGAPPSPAARPSPTPPGASPAAAPTWAASDQFHFVWQAVSGGTLLSARVVTQTMTGPWTKAGLMLRASTDPGAPFYTLVLIGTTVQVDVRTTQGGSMVNPAGATLSAPVYFKITRAGTLCTAYTSTDGVSWTMVPNSAISMPALPTTVLAGLAIDSNNASASSTAQVDTVRVGGLSWDPGVTSVPVALFNAPTALGADGRVYLFGGTSGTSTDDRTTYIYTPATNSWSTGATVPVTHTAGQALSLPNGDIAVIGGTSGCGYGVPCSGGTVSNAVDVYTPSSDAWNLPALTTARERFAAVLAQGSLYVLGGASTSAVLTSVETYPLAAHPASWSAGPSLPQAEMGLMAAVDGAGTPDVFGGFDGVHPPTNALWRLVGGSWSSGPPLPQYTDDGAAVTAADGTVALVGGFNGGQYLPTMQVFDPTANGDAGAWHYGAPLADALTGTSAVRLPTG